MGRTGDGAGSLRLGLGLGLWRKQEISVLDRRWVAAAGQVGLSRQRQLGFSQGTKDVEEGGIVMGVEIRTASLAKVARAVLPGFVGYRVDEG